MLFVHCILCISCICFVFVSYALTLSMNGLSYMFCSVNKDFCHLLITFANSKDPDQGWEECWSLSWSKLTDNLIVYSWKNLLKKVIFKKKSADDKKFIEKRSFWFYCIVFEFRHCLRVRYRTSRLRGYGSGTGHLDTDSRGPVPDTEPRLWGLSRGPVVCETTTDKSRNTGPYLHVYVVTVILPAKTHVEVSLCFVRHLWFSKGNQSVFTVMRHTIQTIKLIQKVYK